MPSTMLQLLPLQWRLEVDVSPRRVAIAVFAVKCTTASLLGFSRAHSSVVRQPFRESAVQFNLYSEAVISSFGSNVVGY